MARVALLSSLALAALAAQACKAADPLYCDENTPCTSAERPFCDLEGAFAASGGVARTCIADPSAGNLPDGGMGEPDAMPSCESSAECPESAPICRANSCTSCSLGGGNGDAECAARDIDRPFCSFEGTCFECVSNQHCSDPARPVCDLDTGNCVPCEADGSCDSGICNSGSGECVPDGDIVYVDPSSGNDGPSCGSGRGAEACRRLGSSMGGLAKIGGTRRFIHLAGDNLIEPVEIDDLNVVIVGEEGGPQTAAIFPMAFNITPAIRITGGAEVGFRNLVISGGNGVPNGSGIDCSDSTVSLESVQLRNSDAAGLSASDCALDIQRSQIFSNGQQGLLLAGGSAGLNESEIRDNGFQGLRATGSAVEIARTLIRNNAAGGVRLSSSSFVLESNVIADNGDPFVNPSSPAGGVAITNSASISPQIIRHNTIANNRGPAFLGSAGVDCSSSGLPVTINSSIVVGNAQSGSSAQVAGNCQVSFSAVPGIGTGTGNVETEPSFVNPGAGDYHLGAGSAGIDIGDPASPTQTDLDGTTRPQGAGFDMGAFEQ